MVSAQYSQAQNAIHPHFHDSYQLIYVLKGAARVTVSGKQYSAKAGTLVLISRLESHEIQIETEDYSRYTVEIAPQIVQYSDLLGETLFSVLINRPEQFRHALDFSAEPRVRQLLAQMVEETEQENGMTHQMQLFLLGQLLVLCCRAYPELLPDNTRNVRFVQKIQRYIEKNAEKKLTLTELSEQFNISQSYLSHLFKSVTGCSVLSYLNAYRLLMAKHYLVQTDWEIGRIVEVCGFRDNSNFSRTFKKTTGYSPSAFRSKYQE